MAAGRLVQAALGVCHYTLLLWVVHADDANEDMVAEQMTTFATSGKKLLCNQKIPISLSAPAHNIFVCVCVDSVLSAAWCWEELLLHVSLMWHISRPSSPRSHFWNNRPYIERNRVNSRDLRQMSFCPDLLIFSVFSIFFRVLWKYLVQVIILYSDNVMRHRQHFYFVYSSYCPVFILSSF